MIAQQILFPYSKPLLQVTDLSLFLCKESFYLWNQGISTYKAFLWNTSQQLLQYDWQVHQVIWPTVYPHQLTSHKVFPGLLVTNQNKHDNHSSLLDNTGKNPIRARTTPNNKPTHILRVTIKINMNPATYLVGGENSDPALPMVKPPWI